ncbi:MAG: hypothetical protein ACRD44_09350, partial [Bryobacteraceae bacterium]
LVRPLKSIAGTPWTIVAFRDKTITGTAMIQVMTIVSRFLAWYGLGLLAALGVLFMLPRRDPFEARLVNLIRRLWPDSRLHVRYRRINLACGFLLMVLLAAIFAGSSWIRIVAGLAPLPLLVAVVLYVSRERPSGPVATRVPVSYALGVFQILLLISVIPCLAFYQSALEFEMSLLDRHTQMMFRQDLRERQDRVRRQVAPALVEQRLTNPLKEDKARFRDVYLASRLETKPGSCSAAGVDARPPGYGWLGRWMAGYRRFYNRYAVDSHLALAGDDPGGRGTWCREDGRTWLASPAAGLRIAATPAPNVATTASWVVLLVLCRLAWLWTSTCVRRVFSFDLSLSPWSPDTQKEDYSTDFVEAVAKLTNKTRGKYAEAAGAKF